MPPWDVQTVTMRRKAKSEGRLQGYNDILKYYKAEVRRIFPNDSEEHRLYKFLQEKYTVLYFWPDRADWEEHWQEWFDDERSQPHHTITLSDKNRTKTGPKLSCSLADWDVFQTRKAGVTPAGYTTQPLGTASASTNTTSNTPLWSVQGNSLRTKAKREGREQEYDEVLRVYKDEARSVFTHFPQHMSVNRFLQEKYTVLRFWPDRVDWLQHWSEWYEDERSQPKHTTIEKDRKMGPKLTITLSDWEVYVSKAFDTYTNKEKAKHSRYLNEVSASTSTNGYGTATSLRNAQNPYDGAQSKRPKWGVDRSKQFSKASTSKKGRKSASNFLPESQGPSIKTEDYTENPWTAPKSRYSAFPPDSYAPYGKTEKDAEMPWTAPKSQTSDFLPGFKDLHGKTREHTGYPLMESNPRSSNFWPDAHAPYVRTENGNDFFPGNVAAFKSDISSAGYSSGMQPMNYLPPSRNLIAPKSTASMYFDPPLSPKNPPANSSVKREVDLFLDNMDYEFDGQQTKKRRTDNGTGEGRYFSGGSEWN